jgi:CheY-like chemotaxis protein
VTAHARDKDQEHALDAGFHGYLTKPIELYDLAICIARVTGKLPSERLNNGIGDGKP